MKKCGKRTEVYSRVTGYFRPVSNWNAGKQEEFRNRLSFLTAPEPSHHADVEGRLVTADSETCACS